MKARKMFCVVLVILLAFAGIVTGCSSEEENIPEAQEKSAPSSDPSSDGDTSEELEPVELLFYMIGTPARDLDKVFEEVSKYTKEKINATVNMVMYDWGEYNQRMQVIVNSGEQFDICFTSSWANDYRANAERGAFLEINDLLDEYGQDIKEVLNPSFLTGSQINGKNYAVPVNKELGAQAVWNVNVNIAEKYGIDYQQFTDLASLEPALEKVKQGEGAGLVPFLPSGDWLVGTLPFDQIIPWFGVQFDSMNPDSVDYEVVNMAETSEFEEFVKTMRHYYQKGYVREDIVTNPERSFDLDRTGDWFISAYHYMPYHEIADSANRGYPVDVVKNLENPVTRTGSVTGSMHAISVTSDNPERAMMFLNLLNSDKELRVLVGSGIEGEHYEIEDGRQVRLEAGIDNYGMPEFALGNVFLNNLTKGEPEDKWEAFEEFNDAAVDAPTLGFWVDTDNIQNEIAAINNVTQEYVAIITNGLVDPDKYLPEFIEKMNDAGSDKVVAELQEQLNDWLENNN